MHHKIPPVDFQIYLNPDALPSVEMHMHLLTSLEAILLYFFVAQEIYCQVLSISKGASKNTALF